MYPYYTLYLIMCISNKDKPGDFIGKVSIPLSEITPNGESTSRQFDLKSHGGKTRGCIEVKLKVQAEIVRAL